MTGAKVPLSDFSERNLAALRRSLRRSHTFSLFLVLADGRARAEVRRRLAAWSGADGLPALHFFPDGVSGARAVVDALSTTDAAPFPGAVILDGDTLLDEKTPVHALNVARDVLGRVFAGPLVIVLAPQREAELARLAPDLFDVRRATYEIERAKRTIVEPISTAGRPHEKLDPRLAALIELDDFVFEPADPEPLAPRSIRRPDDEGGRTPRPRGAVFSTVPVFVTAKGGEALESIRLRAGVPAWRCHVGNLATADLSKRQLREIEGHEDLVAVEWTGGAKPAGRAAERDGFAPRSALGLGNGASRLDGSGVVIGIVDTEGIDLYHPAFVTEGGYPRLLALWDQSAERSGDHLGSVPAPYGYGVSYTQEDLRQELNPNRREPYARVPHQALKLSHGTMVAGVAAGGRVEDTTVSGVAPGADIVFVDTWGSGAGALAAMTEIAEAVHYVFTQAGDRPCVVNLGLGDPLGPQDGGSPVERFFDQLLAEQPGRAIVIAAGNSQNTSRHAAGVLTAGARTATLGVEVRGAERSPFGGGGAAEERAVLEIWYDRVAESEAGIAVAISSPDGALVTREVFPDGLARAFDLGSARVLVASLKRYPGSDDALIRVEMFPASRDAAIEAGTFLVELTGDGVQRTFHAGLDHSVFRLRSDAAAGAAPAAITLTSPGTCRTAVTVGTCDPSTGRPAKFSGVGPGRHGVDKPDVLAPGIRIRAPAARTPRRYYSEFTGGSASTALVSGAVALLFQHALERGERLLTAEETRALVRAAATHEPDEHEPDEHEPDENERGRPLGRGPGRLTLPADGDLDALFAAAGVVLPPAPPGVRSESGARAARGSEPPSRALPPDPAALRALESSNDRPPPAVLADAWLRRATAAEARAETEAETAKAAAEWDDAMAAAAEVVRLGRASGYHGAVVSALGVQARSLAALGRTREAERAAREALAVAAEHLGEDARAAALEGVASVLEARGAIADALEIRQEEQLPLLERIGDARGRAAALRRIADLYERLGEADRAIQILRQEVVPAFEKLGDAAEAEAAATRIAEVREARGEIGEGLLQRVEAQRASSPFPGIAAFDEDRAPYFFGREDDVMEALDRLARSRPPPRWLQIEGPSGAGKSSLARAGVVPAVRAGLPVDGLTAWVVAVMRPGQDPLASLAEALARHARPRLDLHGRGLDDVRAELAASTTALALLAREALPRDHGLLLVVDDLEDAFTLAGEEAVQRLDALLSAALDDESAPILLVTTVRSDFVTRTSELPGLGARLSTRAARLRVSPMREAGLRAAIEKPARRAGLDYESGLVDRIVGDVRSSSGALSLVAHLLQALHATRRGRTMTLSAYERLGGVGGVLVRGADAVLHGLSAAERRRAQRLLLRLVKVRRGSEDARQRVPRDDAVAAAGGGPDAERVLLRLSGGHIERGAGARDAVVRLVTVSSEPGAEHVDLVHGALVHDWNTLRAWIDEARPALELRDDVEESARIWEASGGHPDALPRGTLRAYFQGVDRGALRAFAAKYMDAADEAERRA